MIDIGAVKKIVPTDPVLDFAPQMVLNDAALIAEKIRELIADNYA